jgi:hypothetical protein
MLDQAEDFALAVRQRIEPALAAMGDSDDGGAAAVFHRVEGALLDVEGDAPAFESVAQGTLASDLQVLLLHISPRPFAALPFLLAYGPTLGHEPKAANSNAGKGGVCNPALVTCCAAAQPPLPGTARKRHSAASSALVRSSSAPTASTTSMSISGSGAIRATSAATLAQ